ncbi:TlpA family protein disulfide reductase [Sphingobacterium detergens]|uniref:Thiol-disulfide isomerase/thioredoxin n=1 Tax=Sphingobacterium detergens TaxID=1145106 RepID=A0A420BK38_SPHD1|nr:TlpA disulfide reductase family protein [Sphingobacterium detergens]RKE57083.1 thiol-disulfide isomerase/thioredoxin [Sphingobacterium detergens]
MKTYNSAYGKEIARKIASLKGGSPGSKAFEFQAADINGKPLELAVFKGKYVLLDFWASWCVPCRKGNPHLIDLYGKYKNKGFEIIGVASDDQNPAAWLKAVEQDKIEIWNHVLSGLKMEKGEFDRSKSISDHYGISTLPTKILINPEGIIVGRYGSGAGTDDELDKKLAEVFGAQ